MTYQQRAAAIVELAGQELINRAEELVGKMHNVTCIDITVHIPTLTERSVAMPEIKVATSLYFDPVARRAMIQMMQSEER